MQGCQASCYQMADEVQKKNKTKKQAKHVLKARFYSIFILLITCYSGTDTQGS